MKKTIMYIEIHYRLPKYTTNKQALQAGENMAISRAWVKLIYSETPQKSNVKQGHLHDEGDFYRVVGDTSETLVRKGKVISITRKSKQVRRNETIRN